MEPTILVSGKKKHKFINFTWLLEHQSSDLFVSETFCWCGRERNSMLYSQFSLTWSVGDLDELDKEAWVIWMASNDEVVLG